MAYKCPRCGLVYEREEKCPLCGWPINAPFKPDEPGRRYPPKVNCPECGKEMELGTLRIAIDYIFHGYEVKWFQKDEEIAQKTGDMLSRPWSSVKPGAICRQCGLIFLRWEDLVRHEKPA